MCVLCFKRCIFWHVYNIHVLCLRENFTKHKSIDLTPHTNSRVEKNLQNEGKRASSKNPFQRKKRKVFKKNASVFDHPLTLTAQIRFSNGRKKKWFILFRSVKWKGRKRGKKLKRINNIKQHIDRNHISIDFFCTYVRVCVYAWYTVQYDSLRIFSAFISARIIFCFCEFRNTKCFGFCHLLSSYVFVPFFFLLCSFHICRKDIHNNGWAENI